MSGGKPVMVTEMYSPSEERREGSDHRGRSCPTEETAPRRRFLRSRFAG